MTSIGGKAQELIGARLLEHEKLVHKVMGSKRLLKAIEEAVGLISLTLASGGKVMFCGNGGSAADASTGRRKSWAGSRRSGRGWRLWPSLRTLPS